MVLSIEGLNPDKIRTITGLWTCLAIVQEFKANIKISTHE